MYTTLSQHDLMIVSKYLDINSFQRFKCVSNKCNRATLSHRRNYFDISGHLDLCPLLQTYVVYRSGNMHYLTLPSSSLSGSPRRITYDAMTTDECVEMMTAPMGPLFASTSIFSMDNRVQTRFNSIIIECAYVSYIEHPEEVQFLMVVNTKLTAELYHLDLSDFINLKVLVLFDTPYYITLFKHLCVLITNQTVHITHKPTRVYNLTHHLEPVDRYWVKSILRYYHVNDMEVIDNSCLGDYNPHMKIKFEIQSDLSSPHYTTTSQNSLLSFCDWQFITTMFTEIPLEVKQLEIPELSTQFDLIDFKQLRAEHPYLMRFDDNLDIWLNESMKMR